MTAAALTSLGFTRSSSHVQNDIFIPRYYEPRIADRLAELRATHDLVSVGDLIDAGHVSVHFGHDIGKHHYGGGDIPYVRTSDLATWEVVGAPKQTVSLATYEHFQKKQDVREGDILFIRDGLYLIGRAAIITEHDLPLIHQSHLLRLRVEHGSPISRYLLLALLGTPVVRLQVRSKQFTAGIIDKIEDRYKELVLPVPKDSNERNRVDHAVQRIVERRAVLRSELDGLPRRVQGITKSRAAYLEDASTLNAKSADTLLGYRRRSSDIQSNILLPKYYSPAIDEALTAMSGAYKLRSIGELEDEGVLQLSTGLEVGKLAYGQGDVPFIRTSDLANWELAGQPKQLVSERLYQALVERVDLRADDILLVRDGTYLVGTSAILTEADARALYAGGLYRVRVSKPDELDPYLLICVLNSPIVRLQMRSKQFTRDIIDTLGRRLREVVVPIPLDRELGRSVAASARAIVEERVALREEAREIVVDLETSKSDLDDAEREIANGIAL